MSLDWDRDRRARRAAENGTQSSSAKRYIPANDPIRIEARRRKRERDARPTPAANALGLDRPTYKKLNAEFKAERLSGKTLLSYNDWMKARLQLA